MYGEADDQRHTDECYTITTMFSRSCICGVARYPKYSDEYLDSLTDEQEKSLEEHVSKKGWQF